MPSTAVYFEVLPSLMARIAASLMLSGVSKSGSPAPRPMTSRPASLSARALSVTAMVADGLMRLSERASNSAGAAAGLSCSAAKAMGNLLITHLDELPNGPGGGQQVTIYRRESDGDH